MPASGPFEAGQAPGEDRAPWAKTSISESSDTSPLWKSEGRASRPTFKAPVERRGRADANRLGHQDNEFTEILHAHTYQPFPPFSLHAASKIGGTNVADRFRRPLGNQSAMTLRNR